MTTFNANHVIQIKSVGERDSDGNLHFIVDGERYDIDDDSIHQCDDEQHCAGMARSNNGDKIELIWDITAEFSERIEDWRNAQEEDESAHPDQFGCGLHDLRDACDWEKPVIVNKISE